jgi:hypothetical protein
MNSCLFRTRGIGIFLVMGFFGCASLAPRDITRAAPAPAGAAVAGAYMDPLPGGHTISLFGPRGRRTHDGIDLKKSAAGGDAVVAARDGTVETARRRRGYGLTVVILHPDGSRTRYAHLQKFLVDEDQQVTAGQKIGIVGATGNATTPHLHFEILTALGRCVDPVPCLQAVAVAQSDQLSRQTAKAVAQPVVERKEGLPEEVTGNKDFCAWNRKWENADPSFSADKFERIAGLSEDEDFTGDINIINATELRNATQALNEYPGADRGDEFKIYSPDRTKFIWNAGYPDPLKIDRNVLLFDSTANIYRHLLRFGTDFRAEKVFWMNDHQFMVIVTGEINGAKGSNENTCYYQHTLYLYDLEKSTVAKYLSPELIGCEKLDQFKNDRTIQSAATGSGSSFAK